MSLGTSGLGAAGLAREGVGLGGAGFEGGAAAESGIIVGAGVAYGVTINPSGTTPFTLPAHNNGDLLLLGHYVATTDDLTDVYLVSTPGWIELAAAERRVFSGSAMTQRVWTKFGDGVETEVLVNNSGASQPAFSLACVPISGVDPAIFDVTPLTAHGKLQNNSPNPTAIALTTTVDGAVMFLFCGHSREFTTYAPPTGYSDNAKNSFLGATIYACSKKVDVAGLEAPGPWNTTGVNSGADPLLMSVTLTPLVTDDVFDNVVLLLDFDGADGGTDITDLSNSGHVDTFFGDAEIDTAVTALGRNTVLLDGSGDYITFPDSADWDFGTGDFTVECHFQSALNAVTGVLLSVYDTPLGWSLQHLSGAALRFLVGDTLIKSETWNPVEGTMFHVSVTRSGTDVRMFIDGVELGSATTDSTDLTGSTNPLTIGALGVPQQFVNGNIGAVRITKGFARYTANFTPPAVFYPTS